MVYEQEHEGYEVQTYINMRFTQYPSFREENATFWWFHACIE